MNDTEQTPKIIDELYAELSPSQAQRVRVANSIFSRIEDSRSRQSSNYKSMNMKNFLNWKFALAFGGALFTILLAVPMFVYFGLGTHQSQTISEDIIAEDYGITSNFERTSFVEGGSNVPSTDMIVEKSMMDTRESQIQFPGMLVEEYYDDSTLQQDRVQVKSGNISIEVVDFQSSYNELTSQISFVGGYVVSVVTNSVDEYNYSNIHVRVPVEKFDEFVNFVRALGYVSSENISIQDKQSELTQYSNSLHLNESRLSELKQKKTPTYLEVEEIKTLEKLIEGDKLAIENIKIETSFSDLDIYMEDAQDDDSDWNFESTWNEVLDALKFVIEFWASIFMWLLVPAVCIVPILVIATIILLTRKFRKK